MTTKVEETVGLAQQISGPEQQLKKLENAMSLKEYVQYIDETGRGKAEADGIGREILTSSSTF